MERRNTYGHENAGEVTVYPSPLTVGEHINVIYDGLLAKSGADQIWLRTGYGPQESWHDVRDLQMLKTGRGWELTFQVADDSRINFCFKDSAEHWDNYNGHNWSFEVHNGATY